MISHVQYSGSILVTLLRLGLGFGTIWVGGGIGTLEFSSCVCLGLALTWTALWFGKESIL
jgi:hypothetical protein